MFASVCDPLLEIRYTQLLVVSVFSCQSDEGDDKEVMIMETRVHPVVGK